MGAALAVRHRGAWIARLWGGVADARTGRPWSTDNAIEDFMSNDSEQAVRAPRLPATAKPTER